MPREALISDLGANDGTLGALVGQGDRIEAAVREAFDKRFGRQSMSYESARELVLLERELVVLLIERVMS